MTSGRAPSLASTGPTTPSRCWRSANSRCSGSTDWWLCWSASDCAACIASCAFTVNFSNLITATPLSEIRPRIVGPLRLQFLIEIALGRREIGRHDDLDLHELVAAPAATRTHARHPVSGQAKRPSARGGRRDLHRNLAPQRRHLDVCSEGRLGRGDRQLELDVVALALEERMGRDGHGEIEVTPAAGRARALAGHAHALPRLHAGRNFHVELPPPSLPAGAATGRARLAADVAGAVAGRAGLIHLERERLARARVGFFQRDLDASLNVIAASARLAAAEAATNAEQVLELHAASIATSPARPGTEIAEDRAEEVGEVAAVAALILNAEASARLTGALPGGLLGVALPVGAERVVATALLRIGEHLVRLVDLLEAVGRVLRLGDVGMVLSGQPAEGGLDRLVVGLPIDAEDLVVVLELDGHI